MQRPVALQRIHEFEPFIGRQRAGEVSHRCFDPRTHRNVGLARAGERCVERGAIELWSSKGLYDIESTRARAYYQRQALTACLPQRLAQLVLTFRRQFSRSEAQAALLREHLGLLLRHPSIRPARYCPEQKDV